MKVKPVAMSHVLLPLALLLAAPGCSEEPAPEPPPVRPVKILTVKGPGQGLAREYPGEIQPVQNAEMAFEVPGRIIEFNFREGENVAKGDVLAKLDPRDFESRLASSRAVFDQMRIDLERAQKLFDERVLARSTLDLKRNEFDKAKAELAEAQKALDDCELVAPFSGLMARKLVKDFEAVPAKKPVLILQDDTLLEIKSAIPERDLAGRRSERSNEEITQEVRPYVVVTALPDLRFPAALQEVATTADPVTRTFEATFVFDRPSDDTVLPGMTAKLVLTAAQEGQGTRIPVSAAVADPEGGSFVWKVDPATMTVSRLPVVLGDLSGSEVIIQEGLRAGDQIAVSGVASLRDGMKVGRFGG